MSIFLNNSLPPKPMITWLSDEGIVAQIVQVIGNSQLSSSATSVASKAHYIPFRINAPTLILQLWCANGASVAGTVDVGVYALDGTRISSSGATTQAGTTTIQTFDVTDFWIGPGQYYMALSSSSTSATFLSRSAPSVLAQRASGILAQASVATLPATATFAAVATADNLPIFGLATTLTI